MYVRACARENKCVHARNDVGEMTTAGRKNSAGGAPPSKDCLIIKKDENFPPHSFFSYTVSPTSEIVFSTSEVDFPISEFFQLLSLVGEYQQRCRFRYSPPPGTLSSALGRP